MITRRKLLNNTSVLLLTIDKSKEPPKEGRKNLLAVDKYNEIIWIAELPTEVYDSYVDMKFVNGVIKAESSNSFVSEINPETGIIIKKYLVK